MTSTETPATAVHEQGEGSAAMAGTTHGPMCLNNQQRDILLRGVNLNRVSKLDKGGQSVSHMEAYDIRAHLTRIFGFANWSEEILEVAQTFETDEQRTKKIKKDGKQVEKPYTAWTVGYRATVRLTVNCPHGVPIASHAEVAADSSDAQPGRGDAHHNALTAAASTALKRAATNLGDQFGLSLYKKGSVTPLVMRSLVAPPAEQTDSKQDTQRPDEHIQEPLPREEDATREPRESVSVPYEGDDWAAAQATVEPEEGAPRGPEQIRADAIAARDLPPQERMQRISELMTELTRVGGDLAVKTALIGLMQSARQAAERAKAHAAAAS